MLVLYHRFPNDQIHTSSASSQLLSDAFLARRFITGGSSGGSAAAVAAGMAVFGIGSDTGGSVRNPASYCGVVGLKPGYGRLSRHGLIPLVNALDVPGLLATSAEDAAIVFAAAAGVDPKDATSRGRGSAFSSALPLPDDLRGLRIGVPREYHAPVRRTCLWRLVRVAWPLLSPAGP